MLWALLAVVAFSTACEADASPGGAASAPAATTEPIDDQSMTPDTDPHALMAWPDGETVEIADIDVPAPGQARTAHVELLRTMDFNAMAGGTLTVRAVSAGGVALVDSMDPEAFDLDTWMLNATTPVSLWTDSGLEPVGDTTGLVPGDPHRQVIGAAFAGETVTWQETASTNLFVSDWRMFRRDLDGGNVELLARSEQVYPDGNLPGAVGNAMLVPSGDRVGWHTTFAREDGTLRTRLVSVPAEGGDLRQEADLVAMPEGVADGWVALRMVDQSVPGAEEGWQIQDPNTVASIDLVEPGGSARALIEFPGGADGTSYSWGIAQLAAGGGEVYAWSASDGQAYAASVDGSRVVRLRQPPGMEVVPHSLAVCDERVVWSAADAAEESPAVTYLFDPTDEQITLLPSENGLGNATCGGSYIAWTEVSLDDIDVRSINLARQQ